MSYNIGNIIIKDHQEDKYAYIGEIYDGLALVRTKDNLYGYINQNGEEVIPCSFEYAADFSEGLALTLPTNSKQYQFIKPDGSIHIVCPKEYITVGSFHDGRSVVSKGKYQYGYIDKKGKEVIPCQYLKACNFGDGLAVVEIPFFSTIRVGNKKIMVIDIYGNRQQQWLGQYCFFDDDSFCDGLFPLKEYISSSVMGEHHCITIFLDKEGVIYRNKNEVEKLNIRYQAKKKASLAPKEIDRQKLVYFCSEVTFLGTMIKLKTDSKENLRKKKKTLLADIKRVVEVAEHTLMAESKALEKSKEKIKA